MLEWADTQTDLSQTHTASKTEYVPTICEKHYTKEYVHIHCIQNFHQDYELCIQWILLLSHEAMGQNL